MDKLTGRARYVDDIEREGMWHGATVRSAIPRGLIRAIRFDPGVDWREFAVVTAADIPGKNHIQLIFTDQPCLADGRVNHCEEAIVLLAHPSPERARAAAGKVGIEYDPLPPVLTLEQSERQEEIVWGSDNLLKSFLLEKGERLYIEQTGDSRQHIAEALTSFEAVLERQDRAEIETAAAGLSEFFEALEKSDESF